MVASMPDAFLPQQERSRIVALHRDPNQILQNGGRIASFDFRGISPCLFPRNLNAYTDPGQSQWAWGNGGDHGSGVGDVGTQQYSAYWHSFDDNCDVFKQYQTGWFIHAWAQESTFDMLKDDGSYATPAWKPKRC